MNAYDAYVIHMNLPMLEMTVRHETFSKQIWCLSKHFWFWLDKMSKQWNKTVITFYLNLLPVYVYNPILNSEVEGIIIKLYVYSTMQRKICDKRANSHNIFLRLVLWIIHNHSIMNHIALFTSHLDSSRASQSLFVLCKQHSCDAYTALQLVLTMYTCIQFAVVTSPLACV